MRLLRIASVLIFLLSILSFAGFQVYEEDRIDVTAPEIIFDKDSFSLSIDAPREELLQGVTAFDSRDGDVSSSLIIE